MTDSSRRFLFLFALANAGGVIAYAPLLTLLLPSKISALAGASRIEWLSAATFAGALAASVGNIVFGWASDVAGTRRQWAIAGLGLTLASYLLVHLADSAAEVVAAIMVYQLALNMLLAPLAAWAADKVPDHQKGLLGGLLGLGPPLGALAGVVATLPIFSQRWMQMASVCVMVFILTAPILLVRSRPEAALKHSRVGPPERLRLDLGLLWVARLLVQVAGGVLFAFLLYYFQSLPKPLSDAHVARISAATLAIAFPITLGLGRLSDRLGPRKPFLIGSAVTAAGGLAILASQASAAEAVVGYAIFGCATAVFLSLHSTFAMQLLPSPERRGRDLGFLNLTNTLPALIAPLLGLWLIPRGGFQTLLGLLAALLVLAAIFVLLVRSDRQAS